MELGGLVRKYREMLGLSQAELGRAVGVSQATIDKIESGRTTLSRFLPRIAARLGIPPHDLDPLIGAQPRQPVPREANTDENHDLRPRWLEEEDLRVIARDREDMARRHEQMLRRGRSTAATPEPARPGVVAPTSETDLPVYIADVDAFPIDWVKRPPPLANVFGAYGFLVKESAMEPEFWPGDIALVHPHLPPAPQSACVFKTEAPRGEARSQPGHLVGFDAAVWRVRQWNPPPGMKGEFTLARNEWPICHRVVGKYSRG